MTLKEIIEDEKYHTCGRCKWEGIFPPFICNQCKWGEDTRKDLWQLKDGVIEEEPDDCVDGEEPNTPEVNLYEVELMLERLIERDQNDPYIKKPIAHALYLTWKWAEEYERSRDDGRTK